jgi:large subunit ribosomal protein L30
MAAKQSIRITQRKSASGANKSQRETLRSLGLRGIGGTVERQDGPALQGMVRAVRHLIEVSRSGSEQSKSGGGSG